MGVLEDLDSTMSLNIIPPSLRTDSGSLAGETVPAADQSCHVS